MRHALAAHAATDERRRPCEHADDGDARDPQRDLLAALRRDLGPGRGGVAGDEGLFVRV